VTPRRPRARPRGRWSADGRLPPPPGGGRARGQASVELALVLPLVLVLLLVLVQVGLVVRDQILVVHAAREAAREAAVDPSPEAAQRAAESSSGLDPARLEVEISGRAQAGSRVKVVARYRSSLAVPLLSSTIEDVPLRATATMRVER
jgi:zona occludens toxin (predicted ATPase)